MVSLHSLSSKVNFDLIYNTVSSACELLSIFIIHHDYFQALGAKRIDFRYRLTVDFSILFVIDLFTFLKMSSIDTSP